MSIVIKAQGEAQSAKLVGEAIKDNPGFIQLRRIDAARDIASTVARYEVRGSFMEIQFLLFFMSFFLFVSEHVHTCIYFQVIPPEWAHERTAVPHY